MLPYADVCREETHALYGSRIWAGFLLRRTCHHPEGIYTISTYILYTYYTYYKYYYAYILYICDMYLQYA
jgi:hypothetical protein